MGFRLESFYVFDPVIGQELDDLEEVTHHLIRRLMSDFPISTVFGEARIRYLAKVEVADINLCHALHSNTEVQITLREVNADDFSLFDWIADEVAALTGYYTTIWLSEDSNHESI